MSDTPFSRGSRAAPSAIVLGDPGPLADRADNRVLVPVIEGAPPRPPVVVVEDGTGQDHWCDVRPDNIDRVAALA